MLVLCRNRHLEGADFLVHEEPESPLLCNIKDLQDTPWPGLLDPVNEVHEIKVNRRMYCTQHSSAEHYKGSCVLGNPPLCEAGSPKLSLYCILLNVQEP